MKDNIRFLAAVLLAIGRASRPDEALAIAESTIVNISNAFAEGEGEQAAEDLLAIVKGKLQ